MKMKPKLSVIVPVYNVESYIEETLNCLVNQTFLDNIEVLLIDDGSTDDSRYIVEKYAFEYKNFYAYHTSNRGLCSTRNFGLIHARGEYICFLDADDIITYDMYERLYNFAKKGDYDVVTTKFLRFDSEKIIPHIICETVFTNPHENIENSNLNKYVGLTWDMVPWNKIIKKDFLDENNIRFSYKNIIHEDNLFSIELYTKAKKVGGLNEYHYFWRKRSDSTSISQYQGINKGKQLYEMVTLVNEFIINNIFDKEVLDKKYEKILTIDFYYFTHSIKGFQRTSRQEYFQYLYKIIKLIPKIFIENQNSYFRVMCEIIKNKDFENIIAFTSIPIYNPILPENLDKIYAKKLDLRKDSYYEKLEPHAYNILLNDSHIVIEFNNNLKFNLRNNFDEVYFKLKSNSETLYESKINTNQLHIPLELLNSGKNELFITCYLDSIKKENCLKTELNKIFSFDNYNLTIRSGKTGNLHLIKNEKKNNEINIIDVNLDNNNIHFRGTSNAKLENITINDYFDFEEITYNIDWREHEFYLDIPFKDFLKVPIKKWQFKSKYKIKIIKEYEFITEKYLISVKNQYNELFIEFNRHTTISKIKELKNQIN